MEEGYEESYKDLENQRDSQIKNFARNIPQKGLIILGIGLLIIFKAYNVDLIWYVVTVFSIIILSAVGKGEGDKLLVPDEKTAESIVYKRVRELQLNRTTGFSGMKGQIIMTHYNTLNRDEGQPDEWVVGWNLKDKESGLEKHFIAKVDPWTAGITSIEKVLTEYRGEKSSNLKWVVPERYKKQIEFEEKFRSDK